MVLTTALWLRTALKIRLQKVSETTTLGVLSAIYMHINVFQDLSNLVLSRRVQSAILDWSMGVVASFTAIAGHGNNLEFAPKVRRGSEGRCFARWSGNAL